MAVDVYSNYSDKVKLALFTYGCPRVVDRSTAEKVAAYPFPHYRIINHGDPIVLAPPASFGRYHCKQAYYYKTNDNSKFVISGDLDYDGGSLQNCRYVISSHGIESDQGYLKRIRKAIDRLASTKTQFSFSNSLFSKRQTD